MPPTRAAPTAIVRERSVHRYTRPAPMDILSTEDFAALAIQQLQQRHQVVWDATLWKDSARLLRMLADARTIMVRNQTLLNRDVLAAAPKLLAIGRVGVGLDNIDMS